MLSPVNNCQSSLSVQREKAIGKSHPIVIIKPEAVVFDVISAAIKTVHNVASTKKIKFIIALLTCYVGLRRVNLYHLLLAFNFIVS